VCTVLLPPGVNPIAVNKYIYVYIFFSSPVTASVATHYPQYNVLRHLNIGYAFLHSDSGP